MTLQRGNDVTELKPDYLLIIASSGRMLAQAAKNAGLKPLVIDLFSDLDTRYYATDFKQITALTVESLAPALDYFIKRYPVTQLVYGSGLEQHPDSLTYLQTRLTLLGNSPETFTRLQNKADFFSVLKQLNIPYPESVFIKPNTENWLVKPEQGQGGVGIQRIRNTNPGLYSKAYWQKYQPGSQHSVLFLADGQQMQVIGFNTQWTIRLSDTEEFIFAGILNYCHLTDSYKAQISDWLTKLVPIFQLKGLNSLDFIHADNKSHVLEINPRPPASMQLYDADLLRRHINVDATLGAQAQPQSGYTAYQIIYAEQTVQIPDGTIWENGTVDLPPAGAVFSTGQPICSIITHRKQVSALLQALKIQQHNLQKGLHTHGIQR